jgi:hypothetical protein
MPPELCQCILGTHGHEPGKCPEPATATDPLCKFCRDKALVAGVAGTAVGDAGGPKPSDALGLVYSRWRVLTASGGGQIESR